MRRQEAGPRRKVYFSGRREHSLSPSLARASSRPGPSHVCTWTQQPLPSARPGCGFPLSGRNTGSVSWGQGLWFPVAEPGPGREATNEVCVSERERERQKRRSGEVKETGKEERRVLWFNGKSMTLDVKNSIF